MRGCSPAGAHVYDLSAVQLYFRQGQYRLHMSTFLNLLHRCEGMCAHVHLLKGAVGGAAPACLSLSLLFSHYAA